MDLIKIKNILEQKHLLKELSKKKSRYSKSIINRADSNLIKAICEGILNVLEGKVNLTELDKNKLKKYKFILRDLVKKGPLKAKKNILIQKGGSILPFFLPSVLLTFTQVVGDYISKRNEVH